MVIVTGFGDPAATLGIAFLMTLYFLTVSHDICLRWIAALALCGAMIVAAKLVFYTDMRMHDMPLLGGWISSPSGHVAGSVLVYGALAMIAGRRWLFVLVPAALVALAAIAFSRVDLRMHSVGDVLAGCVVGASCLVWFARGRATSRPLAEGIGLWPVGISLCPGLIAGGLGWRLPVDRLIFLVSGYLALRLK